MDQFGGVQVRPGVIVMGDKSGVVVVPAEWVDQVLDIRPRKLFRKEEGMVAQIRAGEDHDWRWTRRSSMSGC